MKEIKINQNDANQRLDKFLMKTFPKLGKSMMYKAIRNKKSQSKSQALYF